MAEDTLQAIRKVLQNAEDKKKIIVSGDFNSNIDWENTVVTKNDNV